MDLCLRSLVLLLPLLSATRGPVAGPESRVDAYWGVSVSLHPELSRRRGFRYPPDLAPIAELGARAVLLPVSRSQRDLYSNGLDASGPSVSRRDLQAVVRRAHRRGLATALLPYVTVREGPPHHWRGRLAPRDPAAWFRSYGAWLEDLAAFARREQVGMLVVGSELSSLSGPMHLPAWRALCERVRARYGGKLAFVVNHDALDLVALAPLVDVWGVSAYFPLSQRPAPSAAALQRAWTTIAGRLRTLQATVERPLVLFEVGYPSRSTATQRPWDDTHGAPVDLALQQAAYRASVNTLLASSFVRGALYWTWLGPGGPHDRHYTPRAKPAQAELERLFAARRAGWRTEDHAPGARPPSGSSSPVARPAVESELPGQPGPQRGPPQEVLAGEGETEAQVEREL